MRSVLAALALAVFCATAAMAVCGDGTVEPELGEQCDDGNLLDGDCCSSLCLIELAGTVCRSAAGDCDVAETCDGLSNDCPPDAFAPPTTVCRPSAGICDPEEVCTGSAPVCPADLKGTAVCRPSTGQCDVAETCNGIDNDCPPDDPAAANGIPCSDGDACTQSDACLSGACVGSNPVVCTALDVCHVAGTCNSATGVCSNPTRPDNSSCNDGNPCTTADSCQDGSCRGLPIAGCCRVDGECQDAFSCTEDHCVGNACTHVPVDQLCGAGGDCAAFACSPADPAAGPSGCVARASNEASYCSDDDDPCTIDACRSGSCRHEPDQSGSVCAILVFPYRNARDLLERARAIEAALQAAIAHGCPPGARAPFCDVAAGDEPSRLIALLESMQRDLDGAAVALAGRFAATTGPDPSRDPLTRCRLALGLLASTPGSGRAFLATLAQGRARRVLSISFARARRSEGKVLLRGTNKLRRQLLRLVTRRQSFAQ